MNWLSFIASKDSCQDLITSGYDLAEEVLWRSLKKTRSDARTEEHSLNTENGD